LTKHLGQNIRHRRMELGISQSQLAKRIDVTQSYISNIESGARSVTIPMLRKIADALDTTITELLGIDRHSVVFGEDTLRELESLHDLMQYKDMISLINRANGAVYFQHSPQREVLMLWKAKAHNGLFEYQAAVKLCRELLTRANVLDKFSLADVHDTLAKGLIGLNEIELAKNHCMYAYNLISMETLTSKHKKLFRSILSNLGTVYTYMQQYNEAMKYLKKASELIDQDLHKTVKQNADILFTMASIAFLQQDYTDAIAKAKEALRHYEFINYIAGQIEMLNNIAFAYKTIGDTNTARQYFERAVSLAKQHPDSVTPNARKELRNEGYEV
jgi:transcriptional regulator with XRE-family HTH domain